MEFEVCVMMVLVDWEYFVVSFIYYMGTLVLLVFYIIDGVKNFIMNEVWWIVEELVRLLLNYLECGEIKVKWKFYVVDGID